MAVVPLKPKFLRALVLKPPTSGDSANKVLPGIFKVVYEFWGFCVNGGDSLTIPGGFATSHVTGSYIEQPAGFQSGSTVLLASGSDGYTQQGLPYFSTHTAIFTTASLGKHLVIWKSGSTSTDDSIYPIVGVRDAFSVVVDPTTGGTSIGPSGSVPILTARTGINYRLVDFAAAKGLTTYRQGQHMVLQFDGAADVNPGQRNSQAKLVYRAVSGETDPLQTDVLHIHLSPSGSWNGTTFASESYSEIGSENTVDFSSSGPGTWVLGWPGGDQFITIIADKTAIILHHAYESSLGLSSTFVIEIPQRLYPQHLDPNLICARNSGCRGVAYGTNGYGDAHRFFPSPHDTLVRRWPILVRGYMNSWWPFNYSSNSSIASLNTQQYNIFYNPITNKFLSSDGLLALGTVFSQPSAAGQFSLGRALTRTVRYAPTTNVPVLQRVGDGNDRWIAAAAGILYPWDHAIVTNSRLFR